MVIFGASTFFRESTLGGAKISKKSKITKNGFFMFQTNRKTHIRSFVVDLLIYEQKQNPSSEKNDRFGPFCRQGGAHCTQPISLVAK